jgi:hypothetical protein
MAMSRAEIRAQPEKPTILKQKEIRKKERKKERKKKVTTRLML